MQLYTIGHSNVTLDAFVALLNLHGIEIVIDVRSHPFARYAKHFDTDNLKASLPKYGLKYMYMGHQLGGMPKQAEFYDEEGNVNYRMLSSTENFQAGTARLLKGIGLGYKIALMCAEENPIGCHRRLLIAKELEKSNLQIFHIRRDGITQTELELAPSVANENQQPKQLSLFAAGTE